MEFKSIIKRYFAIIAIIYGYGCTKDNILKTEPVGQTVLDTTSETIEENETTVTDELFEWVSTVNFKIAESENQHGEMRWITNSTYDDYKPVYSPDGSKITFFRVFDYGNGEVEDWKTKICVINADGTGFKELTDSSTAHWNPMWTRDGSNKIVFTKFVTNTPYTANIYWTSPDSAPGEEQLISASGENDFAYSSLTDGRILTRKWNGRFNYLLLNPDTQSPTYQTINYPNTYLHKISISPSEKKIAYMKVKGAGDIYTNAVIAYADLSLDNLTISNEKEITTFNVNNITWYPCWNKQEDHVVYALIPDLNTSSIGQIMAYSLDAKTTSKISKNDTFNYRYPNIKGVTK